MPRILKVSFPQNCNGCELCVLETQRQLKRVGLDGALIRIFKEKTSGKSIAFSIDLDPRVNNLETGAILEICPKSVFTISEEEDADLIN